MKVQSSLVEKITITEVQGLDPISLILEDLGDGRGKVTMTCFDESWTSYWGSMGMSLREFLLFAGTGYLVNCFSRGITSTIPDRSKDNEFMIKEVKRLRSNFDIEAEEATEALRELEVLGTHDRDHLPTAVRAVFCEPWYLDWPTQPNPKYEYLTRIVETMVNAVRMEAVA